MSEAVGTQLRAAREARGWSVDEVAGRLRIPVRYVTALETGDAAALPEPTFVRGYVKAYAKALGLDADALLAAVVQVEVRAPRPLIGPEGQVGASRRNTAPVRGPSFRSGSSRRYPMYVGGLLLAAGLTWLAWPDTGEQVAVPVAAVPAPAPGAPAPLPAVTPQANVPPSVAGGVTLAVPLPGAASVQPAVASGSQAAALAVAQPPAATAMPAAAAAQARTAAVANPAVVAGPAAESAPVAPRKGLFARFSGTCWLEVRDADNVVIHTRIAMAGNEVAVDGKAPLTVTLGDASAAEVWYNGDRVAADKFSSNGIARIIVGQTAR